MSVTAKQAGAVIELVQAVAECIRAAGEIPSGHLYARMMGNLNIQTYNSIIDILIGAKLIERRAHLLTWVGPMKEVHGG